MFFEGQHQDFFRPLTSKYREQILECLQLLYSRLYTSQADYSQLLSREMVIDCFQEAIARAPLLETQQDDEFNQPVRNDREQASWTLNLLLEHAWLEKQVDETTLQSTYAFTRIGRLFTQPIIELNQGRFRTRHRNTRNTRNALKIFVEQGDVYDLLDAFEYSERIISDFTDVIGELEERKRSLIQEVESQQLVQKASDEFFDFMEKRFVPDLAIRLSVDSVEKYRDEIVSTIGTARRKRKEFKLKVEQELRKTVPELVDSETQSLLFILLDKIEQRIHNASEIMLPALRRALLNFTRRADIIMRQLSFSYQGGGDQLLNNLRDLAAMDDEKFQHKMYEVSEQLAGLKVEFLDPAQLKIYTGRTRKIIDTRVEALLEMDEDARKEFYLQQVLEKAFTVNNQQMSRYLIDSLAKGHQIDLHQLPVNDAKQLLMRSHAIEAGSAGRQSSEFEFNVEETHQRVKDEYFEEADGFTLKLVNKTIDEKSE
ncbi:Wadjet anti-phage system protein JetA family protein [Aliikangiella coralliicola]|uniref:Flagellar protein FliT n=1 Tax=Aliikangiella coralliicola TaxID=2592383 RepID=A0A545UBR7_9GAMM|nr:Wadjet anti-phage system protein JetA family protein [Aliikangiella coralliicola]TQV86912.1 flagellar protein FliT [Aliikangiella coralliicola]